MTHLSLLIGLYGMCAIVSVVCVHFLPETSEDEIPDTIEEALQLHNMKKQNDSTNIEQSTSKKS